MIKAGPTALIIALLNLVAGMWFLIATASGVVQTLLLLASMVIVTYAGASIYAYEHQKGQISAIERLQIYHAGVDRKPMPGATSE